MVERVQTSAKPEQLSVCSLFSGVSGLCSRGITEAGLEHLFRVSQFVEANPYRRAILARQYPSTPCHTDIRTFTAVRGEFDCVVGGAPCQGISGANPRGSGLDDERSGLWREMYRIINECRPRFVIWENVAAARYPKPGQRVSPLGRVLWDLTRIGYSGEWQTISATSLGAPHKRERIFVIAYTHGSLTRLDQVQTSWAGQIRASLAFAGDDSTGPRINAGIQRVDARTTPRLDGYQSAGWWAIHVPPTIISAPQRSIPNRASRVQALGDSCTPQQAALCWSRVAYLVRLLQTGDESMQRSHS